jgi:hypothetical protein
MWHVLAEPVNLFQASLLHGVLEVNVLAEQLFLFQQLCLASWRQLISCFLQAADDSCITLQAEELDSSLAAFEHNNIHRTKRAGPTHASLMQCSVQQVSFKSSAGLV